MSISTCSFTNRPTFLIVLFQCNRRKRSFFILGDISNHCLGGNMFFVLCIYFLHILYIIIIFNLEVCEIFIELEFKFDLCVLHVI